MREPEKLVPLEDRIDAYVLGLMDPDDQNRFEAVLARDPGLARRVQALSERLVALDLTAEPQPIPEGLWAAIDTRLDARADPVPIPANDSGATVPKRTGLGTGWMAAAGVVLALGIGFLGGTMTRAPEPAPIVVAVLADDQAIPGAIVEAYGDDRVRILPLQAFTAGANEVFEVWTLLPEADGPVSLGTFDNATDLVLEGPDLPDPESGQLFEITLEPAGGSPIGRPTGPILFVGRAQQPVV